MATNLGLDDKVIEQARRLGHHRTKKEAVMAALEEYIRYRKQLDALELRGTIEYEPDYDYRHHRRRRDGTR